MDYADLGPAMFESSQNRKIEDLERELTALKLRVRRLEEIFARSTLPHDNTPSEVDPDAPWA